MYTSLRKKEESEEVLIRFKPRKNGNMGEKEKESRIMFFKLFKYIL